MSETNNTTRRRLLQQAALISGGAALLQAQTTSTTSSTATSSTKEPAWKHLFPAGFRNERIKTSGAEINAVIGGSGPPLLMFHGAPQSLITWRLIAPDLAKDYTVVMCDLRGYGDSSKPEGGKDHSGYSKRPMALDGVEVMKHLGYNQYRMVGHDRGGRVGRRMAIDHPEAVTKLAVMDIVPAHYLYSHVTIEFVQAYFHWFNYLRPAPGPEDELKAAAEAQKARATSEGELEYLRTSADPANIHAMCEDYRAGASIDLKHDEADLHREMACPLQVLWGERSPMGRIYDVLAIWRDRGTKVTGKGLPGGHNLQEDVPEQVIAEVG